MKRHMKRTVISLFLYSENHFFFLFNYCILDKEFENITQAPVMRSLGVENAENAKMSNSSHVSVKVASNQKKECLSVTVLNHTHCKH